MVADLLAAVARRRIRNAGGPRGLLFARLDGRLGVEG